MSCSVLIATFAQVGLSVKGTIAFFGYGPVAKIVKCPCILRRLVFENSYSNPFWISSLVVLTSSVPTVFNLLILLVFSSHYHISKKMQVCYASSLFDFYTYFCYTHCTCGYSLVVECLPSKQDTGVRFSLPAQCS